MAGMALAIVYTSSTEQGMHTMSQVTLTQRSGNNRTYTSDKGLIGVVVCKDPNLYVTTGYYIRTDRDYPMSVARKAYRSAKQAAQAAYNSI